MNKTPYNLITILGPTASGKTRLAALLAARVNGEVISADSRQVYRRMDLGTGKDYNDYIVDGKVIPSHLVDIAEPGYEYNVYEYQRDFVNVFQNITSRGRIPILCGGSGLYLEAVLKGYRLISVPKNPVLRKELKNKSMNEMILILKSLKKLHNITEIENRRRLIRAIEIEKFLNDNPDMNRDYPELNPLVIGIQYDRNAGRIRITERLRERLDKGMVREVEQLMESGISFEKLSYYGLEYKYISLYIQKVISYDDMVNRMNIAIHQFAKRQMTWFRRMERSGMKIHWLEGCLPEDKKLNQAMEWLRKPIVSK